ncbi:hypothetical protein IJG14_02170 [bacterium]|nr:hypothetical protein [bacterium]
MFDKKKINLNSLFVFFTFLILYITLIFLNSCASFILDDMGVVISKEPINFLWKCPDHGTLFAFFLNKFFGLYLANYFNIHPQDFIIKFGIYVKCFLFLLIPLFSTFWGFINKKETKIFIFFFLFLYFLIFNSLRFSMVELAMSTAFYRLTLPILLWLIFWLYFYKYYINSIKPDKKFFITCCILAFIMGNFETESIFSILTFLMLFLYDFCSNPQMSFSKKLKSIEKKYYIPFIFLLIGFIMLITNEGYLLQIDIKFSRYPKVNLFTLPLIFEFLKEYIYQIIYKHITPILIIFLNLIFLYCSKKYSLRKQAFFVLFLFISILLFYFSLFFAGPTCYFGGFWLKHNDLQFILHLCLIIIAIIPIENVFKIIQEKVYQNNILFKLIKLIAICLIIISFIINVFCYIRISGEYKFKNEILRTNMYLYEKMTIFYWQKGKTAVIPYNFEFSNAKSFVVDDNVLYHNLIREFEYKSDDIFHYGYMRTLYPTLKSKGCICTYPEKAFKQFRENGGIINEKELKDLKFTSLYDVYK